MSIALVLPLRAAQAPLSVEADRGTNDPLTHEEILGGNLRIGDGTFLITADNGVYNHVTDVVTVSGHVIFTRGPQRLLADKLVYHNQDGAFTAEHIRLGSYPIYVEGASASGTTNEIILDHATATYGEPGPWQPTVVADRIIFSPGRRLRFENANVGIGPVAGLHLPHFEQGLHEPFLSYVSLLGGYRSSLGAYVQAGLHVPAGSGWKLGGDVGVYTARGVMAGPSGEYTSPGDPDSLKGSFRSGFINDHGDKLTDVLGRPVPENRGYIEWTHQQQVTDNLTIAGQLNYWKDSEIVRDFRPDQFFNVQQPDTFAEAVYTGKNYVVSFFTRLEPNNFETVQQRLPELNFDLLPLPVGLGIYEQFHGGAAILREDPPLGGPTLRSDRLDGYYGLSRPFTPADWLTFTPVVGGRITHYANTAGAVINGSYTRALGEVGFDAQLRSNATFDYKNAVWGIDGLRHVLTPILSYRYIPEGGQGRNHIPLIDRRTFSTDLPSLGLDVTRNIDDLHALNTLRLGIDNTVQTRDPVYGSRDLLVFNTAADLRFHQEPGERDVSEVHTELALMPVNWMRLEVYESFVPQTFTRRTLNSALTLHDGDAWSLRFASHFLSNDTEEYALDGTARFNESYEAISRLHYDARRRRFVEQAYGIRQNLGNTWRLGYTVSIYDGPRREGHFGFNVQLEAIGF
ncbi:MAG TPA: LPS assembly protein LptD [Opitutaceae bacterium]|nr:LPS assembly protein LptD [Opitutaceae bacterium]